MSTTQSTDTSRDEQVARELQAQFDRNAPPVLATPAYQVPYSCGACGTTHAVRNVAHGATFTCTVCGAVNRILLQHHQPVVVVYVRCAARVSKVRAKASVDVCTRCLLCDSHACCASRSDSAYPVPVPIFCSIL